MCQSCGQRPATVHILKTVNNHKEEYHLCEVCAREQGQVNQEPAFGFSNLSLHQLLASMLEEPWVLTQSRPGNEPRCPGCGMSFRQFRETGRFGCGQCYETFERELLPLLRRVQGSEEHRGKAPRRAGKAHRARQELNRLKQELQRAVAMEEFETAARLRDQIKQLEQGVEAGGEGSAVE